MLITNIIINNIIRFNINYMCSFYDDPQLSPR